MKTATPHTHNLTLTVAVLAAADVPLVAVVGELLPAGLDARCSSTDDEEDGGGVGGGVAVFVPATMSLRRLWTAMACGGVAVGAGTAAASAAAAAAVAAVAGGGAAERAAGRR